MGESISLTAFLIKCTATATMNSKYLSARMIATRRLVVCDDMHVNCMVETEIDGQANRKSVVEINKELVTIRLAPCLRFVFVPSRDNTGAESVC